MRLRTIILKNRPIVGTPTLSVRDTNLNEDDFDAVDANIVFTDASAGILNLDFRAVGRWSAYKVTYQAGYTTIPEDLAEACASLACFYVQNADGSDIGVAQKKEGLRELRYANGNQSFHSIAQQLGVDGIIESYANYPITGAM